MRIGIDARMFGKKISGLGTYAQNLTENIFEIDNDNDYYIFLLEPDFLNYAPEQQNVQPIKTSSKWYSYSEQINFLRLVNSLQLDLMHFTHFNAPIFYNKPRITTIHDITPKFFPGHRQKSWWRKKAYALTLKTSLKKSNQIITDSNFTKSEIIKYYKIPKEKISVVYLGIDSDFLVIENYGKIKELKDKHGLTKPFIFFISAWRSHKNFAGLISAFEILKKEGFDYQLVLGGQEDPYYPNIRKRIEQSEFKNDIITPGFISEEELPSFYNAAEIFVLPSFYEGFGLIGLEAMACGTAVASSNAACLPEILGEAALYFEPNNEKDMAEIIKQILTNQTLKLDLKQKGLQQIKKYSWPDCAKKTLEIYNKILEQI